MPSSISRKSADDILPAAPLYQLAKFCSLKIENFCGIPHNKIFVSLQVPQPENITFVEYRILKNINSFSLIGSEKRCYCADRLVAFCYQRFSLSFFVPRPKK
jgi:hypothetical protein